ncbi:kinase-like protein [Schizopora paradoxa]|uniref:Kinase-like protein n=1 Tax=Schizopora paradoxa TaxID=27342 RepID=A0A0H2RJX1_9AGAM|nr:kinase-like protein [Schizopora paradoxa]KLO05086.1 kinase-like protein [Schizopora paradoxa]
MTTECDATSSVGKESSPPTQPSTTQLSAVVPKFIEEPIGFTEDQGHGFPRLDFGQRIGPVNPTTSQSRYRIARKLGIGNNSSVWLAFDEVDERYVAIKLLTGYLTRLIRVRICIEDTGLELVSSDPSPHCVSAIASFVHPGKALPLPLVKRILYHTLKGLVHLHARGVVHTDLKPNNIMFSAPVPPEGCTIEQYYERILAEDPPRLNPPEQPWGPEGPSIQTAVSQPLPMPASVEEAMERVYIVADLGSCQSASAHHWDDISPVALRAPETILRGPWNEKVDIWTFGCLVFELVTGAALFKYQTMENDGITVPEVAHLWQMLLFTSQSFKPEQLQVSERAASYFESNCELKGNLPMHYQRISRFIENYKVLEDEKDIEETEALILRCLRLDPMERPSAEELLSDKWWDEVA